MIGLSSTFTRKICCAKTVMLLIPPPNPTLFAIGEETDLTAFQNLSSEDFTYLGASF